MVKYTLNYFPITGRAETIRILFHAAGVEFNDNRMAFEKWLENKPDCELLNLLLYLILQKVFSLGSFISTSLDITQGRCTDAEGIYQGG